MRPGGLRTGTEVDAVRVCDPDVEAQVQAAMGGDREALRGVWHAHRRWVAAILLAHKPREAEVDDLLQDVAMTVVAKIGGLRDAGALRPWLRAVAVNAAKTAGRRSPRRGARVLGMKGLGWAREEAGADGRVAEAEEGARLLALAAELPEGYREPLMLRCVQGLGYAEISAITGLAETTVETRIARGRRMLRELAGERARGGAGARARGQEV